MKLINLKLILLALVTYCLSMVVLAPLPWVAPFIESRLTPYGVKLENPRGTIWQGETVVKSDALGQTTVIWDVRVLSLFLLKLPVDFNVRNADLNLTGQLSASISGMGLTKLTGFVDDTAAQSITSSYQATLTGQLQLRDVNANVKWSRALGAVSGELVWSGGPVSFPVGRSIETYEVPTIYGELTSDDQQWLFQARGTGQQAYLAASVTRDGFATLSIKRELATEMGVPVPGSGSSLFDVSQKVF